MQIQKLLYQYYILAIQNWCETPKTHYQIHGLWPQYDADTWPENCVGAPPYVPIQNDSLLAEMNSYWHNCNNPVSSLWEHEYTKHLTCIIVQNPTRFPTEESVFQKTVELMESLYHDEALIHYCDGTESDCYVCYDLDFNRLPNCPMEAIVNRSGDYRFLLDMNDIDWE